ncbi:DNA-binding MarR family transcriptional regulator [Actinomadura hallensis]|uniref:DNA-binding MarR family transcriptional regulator n=1 Tax=Actinomadura hallensis TaxID=337895 RepID=A0A543I9S2_9ACTN|nr:MarR family transcriptional regulator [Actinomadura hallensis]TQM67326.1 DNA-binding MarR family transcriptional regulator [Actinomadura hallensis]
MATETSAGNRPDGRRTAEHGPAGQEPADRGPDDREPATRGPAGNEPPEAPRTGAAEQTPAAKAPAAQDQDDEPAPDRILADIGAALLQLRKSWAKPDLMKRIRAQTPAGTDGRPLQISNLMVVNAVAALTADAARHGGTGEPVRAGEAAGSSREITVGAVAERLEIDPSTASRLVGHAIDAGLLTRRPSPVDARRANLGLTEEGRRVKQVADRFRRAYLNELMSGWTAEERAEFARLLTRFADAAARAPGYSDGIDKIFEEARAD